VGTVYVGSWDQYFYALDLVTGKLRWKFHTFPQPAIEPSPGENPRPIDSDGGMVTSSAWFQPGSGNRPDLVIFGGGYTLYALDAHTGALYWSHAYTGNPSLPPNPADDGARIFSSPVVVGNRVLIGVSVDGQQDERGYVLAASLTTGKPIWTYQTDTSPQGKLLNNGCGNVWSSGSVLPAAGLVLFDEADCNFSNPPLTAETVFALRLSTGALVWRYRPHRTDNQCDWDFGATVNVGLNPQGKAVFAGVGGKDGTYYSLNPLNGKLRWKTNVVFGGFSGGFIATAAYDGKNVYGGTSIGDFGRFEHGTAALCDPSNPRDQHNQQPSDHSFNATTGAVRWEADNANSLSPTTVAGGMTFDGQALANTLTIRRASSGSLLATLPLSAPCWSGIATVGNALVLGTGSSENGHPDGVVVFTPGGQTPVVPAS
jgi:outer membrane protein assembly factor BamB